MEFKTESNFESWHDVLFTMPKRYVPVPHMHENCKLQENCYANHHPKGLPLVRGGGAGAWALGKPTVPESPIDTWIKK